MGNLKGCNPAAGVLFKYISGTEGVDIVADCICKDCTWFMQQVHLQKCSAFEVCNLHIDSFPLRMQDGSQELMLKFLREGLIEYTQLP